MLASTILSLFQRLPYGCVYLFHPYRGPWQGATQDFTQFGLRGGGPDCIRLIAIPRLPIAHTVRLVIIIHWLGIGRDPGEPCRHPDNLEAYDMPNTTKKHVSTLCVPYVFPMSIPDCLFYPMSRS